MSPSYILHKNEHFSEVASVQFSHLNRTVCGKVKGRHFISCKFSITCIYVAFDDCIFENCKFDMMPGNLINCIIV